MKSDIHFYVLFQAYPEFLAKLAGIELSAPYAFESTTFKDVVRMVDGWLRPLSNEGTHYVIEFDNWPNKDAYFKVAMAMAQAGIQGTKGPVKGRLIFLNRAIDPRSEPWVEWVDGNGDGFLVYYLDEELERLSKDNPDDLLVSILRPIVIQNPEELKKHVAEDYHRISASDLPEPVKDKILQIVFDWLMQAFKAKTIAEVRQMFMLMTPLEECRPYREIIEIGEKKGIEIGEKKGVERGILLGKILQLEEQFQEKVIQQSYYETHLALLTQQLNELEHQPVED